MSIFRIDHIPQSDCFKETIVIYIYVEFSDSFLNHMPL